MQKRRTDSCYIILLIFCQLSPPATACRQNGMKMRYCTVKKRKFCFILVYNYCSPSRSRSPIFSAGCLHLLPSPRNPKGNTFTELRGIRGPCHFLISYPACVSHHELHPSNLFPSSLPLHSCLFQWHFRLIPTRIDLINLLLHYSSSHIVSSYTTMTSQPAFPSPDFSKLSPISFA